MITIVYGSDHEEADLSGRSVGEVRTMYEGVFHIPRSAIAKGNGQQVGEDYVLKDGEKLSFEKAYDKQAA